MSRILVIDDEVQIRSMIRQALESRGHQVIEAENGQQGVDLFREQWADLVITDIVMPQMAGLDCIIELRQLDPSVPLIAVSGGACSVEAGEDTVWRLELLDAALQLGARHTFWKPFDLAELLVAVDESLTSAR